MVVLRRHNQPSKSMTKIMTTKATMTTKDSTIIMITPTPTNNTHNTKRTIRTNTPTNNTRKTNRAIRTNITIITISNKPNKTLISRLEWLRLSGISNNRLPKIFRKTKNKIWQQKKNAKITRISNSIIKISQLLKVQSLRYPNTRLLSQQVAMATLIITIVTQPQLSSTLVHHMEKPIRINNPLKAILTSRNTRMFQK